MKKNQKISQKINFSLFVHFLGEGVIFLKSPKFRRLSGFSSLIEKVGVGFSELFAFGGNRGTQGILTHTNVFTLKSSRSMKRSPRTQIIRTGNANDEWWPKIGVEVISSHISGTGTDGA